MGYILQQDGFERVIENLLESYRIFAPVRKKGGGRYTDVDVIIYDQAESAAEIVLDQKSDYAFKEFLTPLSETLFFFTEDQTKEADLDEKPVLIFLRSCDLHAVKRLDQIYLDNGRYQDYFYERRRKKVGFVLMGCSESCKNCFCVSMGTNHIEDGYLFSIDQKPDGTYAFDIKEDALTPVFKKHCIKEENVSANYVTGNTVHVEIPKEIPQEILKDSLWDEYTSRCINCGRCNFVCPTCSCYSMQDVFYTDNGKVGERRRVAASCMVDGYTNVAGGGQYRRDNGERMRFKVMHKIYDFRKRFGYDMCVGCGRCDDVCPEYISYTNIIAKVKKASETFGKETES